MDWNKIQRKAAKKTIWRLPSVSCFSWILLSLKPERVRATKGFTRSPYVAMLIFREKSLVSLIINLPLISKITILLKLLTVSLISSECIKENGSRRFWLANFFISSCHSFKSFPTLLFSRLGKIKFVVDNRIRGIQYCLLLYTHQTNKLIV